MTRALRVFGLALLLAVSGLACAETGSGSFDDGGTVDVAGATLSAYAAVSCSWLTACESDVEAAGCLENMDARSFSENLLFRRELAIKIACVKSAKSCTDYEACDNGFRRDTSGECKKRQISSSPEETTFKADCSGNTVVRCVKKGNTYYIRRMNCSEYGLTCAGRQCLYPAVSCDAAYSDEPCSGNFATWCSDYLYEAEDPKTPSEAWDCALTANGFCGNLCENSSSPDCHYGPRYGCRQKTRQSCTKSLCAGPLLTRCDQYGFQQAPDDCRLVDPDFVCNNVETDGGQTSQDCGLPSSAQQACAADQIGSRTPVNCDGNVLQVCLGGKWIKADCARIGATCSTTRKGCLFPADKTN